MRLAKDAGGASKRRSTSSRIANLIESSRAFPLRRGLCGFPSENFYNNPENDSSYARLWFKHVWGEAQRYVGDDKPFSLCLATGVPFEVVRGRLRKGGP